MDNADTLPMDPDPVALNRLASTENLFEVEDSQVPPPNAREALSGEACVNKVEKSGAQSFEPNLDVEGVRGEPPLITRRDQLGAAFRKKGGDDEDGEAGEAEGEEDGEEPPAPKAKAKCKARAKPPPPPKVAPKAKGKAKAKAHAKAEAKAKAGAKQTASKKVVMENDEAESGGSASKRRRTAEPPKPAEKPKAKTWARRYPPSDETELARFNAIRHTFEQEVGPFLVSQSQFQDSCIGLSRVCFDFSSFFCRIRSTSLACVLLTISTPTRRRARCARAWWNRSSKAISSAA